MQKEQEKTKQEQKSNDDIQLSISMQQSIKDDEFQQKQQQERYINLVDRNESDLPVLKARLTRSDLLKVRSLNVEQLNECLNSDDWFIRIQAIRRESLNDRQFNDILMDTTKAHDIVQYMALHENGGRANLEQQTKILADNSIASAKLRDQLSKIDKLLMSDQPDIRLDTLKKLSYATPEQIENALVDPNYLIRIAAIDLAVSIGCFTEKQKTRALSDSSKYVQKFCLCHDRFRSEAEAEAERELRESDEDVRLRDEIMYKLMDAEQEYLIKSMGKQVGDGQAF